MEEHGKELAGYVANENNYLKSFGDNIAYDENTLKTTSTKYITTYPFDNRTDNTKFDNNDANLNIASTNNYKKNTLIYGDGIKETSTTGIGNTAWHNDYTFYPGLFFPFTVRGGAFWSNSFAGVFAFERSVGDSLCDYGFRAVLTVT